MEWKPIDTEPKDDRILLAEVLHTGEYHVGEGAWSGFVNTWADVDNGLYKINATHWMPLPEPPKCK